MLLTYESSYHFSNITFSTPSANSANVFSPALYDALAQRLRQLLSEPELLCQHLCFRSRSRAGASHLRAWSIIEDDVGFCSVKTPHSASWTRTSS